MRFTETQIKRMMLAYLLVSAVLTAVAGAALCVYAPRAVIVAMVLAVPFAFAKGNAALTRAIAAPKWFLVLVVGSPLAASAIVAGCALSTAAGAGMLVGLTHSVLGLPYLVRWVRRTPVAVIWETFLPQQ